MTPFQGLLSAWLGVASCLCAAPFLIARSATSRTGTTQPAFQPPVPRPILSSDAPEPDADDLLAEHTARPSVDGLFSHQATYPPLRLAWSLNRGVQNVLAAYPHPFLPRRILVRTGEGVSLSDDAGRTWEALPQASPDKVGAVRHVELRPDSPEAFYLATDSKGVWMTGDGGRSFQQIGSRRGGLADDSTTGVYVYPADPSFQTLLVCHGHAAGISKSDDGGRTWKVIAGEFLVKRMFHGEIGDSSLFFIGAKKQSPEAQGVYSCTMLGEAWQESLRDVVPIDGAFPVLKGGPYFATADSGVYRLSQDGAMAARVAPEDAPRWSSLGVTWGPTADSQIVYACEPRKLGMAVSSDGFHTFWTTGSGLYTGDFVKEGAHIRANANGTAFYAVVNNALYVGRVREQSPSVSEVGVSPAVLSFARQSYDAAMVRFQKEFLAFPGARRATVAARGLLLAQEESRKTLSSDVLTITARVSGQGGKDPVTVDLSRLGGSPRTPMFDDGRHADGAAGDGVFGAVVTVNPRGFKQYPRDWRRPWPGKIGLSVTALSEDGNAAGAVGALVIVSRPESFAFWDEPDARARYSCQGEAEVELAEANQAYAGKRCLKLTVKGGQWSLPLNQSWRRVSIAGYYALSFWIRTDAVAGSPAAQADEELYVQLRDNPIYSMPVSTPKVPVVQERLVEGGLVAGQYRRVVIPLRRFLQEVPTFQPQLLQLIIFSGEGRSPRTYWIDQVRFHCTPEDVKADRAVEGEFPDG